MSLDVGITMGHRHAIRRRHRNTLSIAMENVEVGGCPAARAERPESGAATT